MSDRIMYIALECIVETIIDSEYWVFNAAEFNKFADLVVQDYLRIMQQEWYDLNNMPVDPEGESPRDVGIRVGRKSEVIALMGKVRKHFGVKE